MTDQLLSDEQVIRFDHEILHASSTSAAGQIRHEIERATIAALAQRGAVNSLLAGVEARRVPADAELDALVASLAARSGALEALSMPGTAMLATRALDAVTALRRRVATLTARLEADATTIGVADLCRAIHRSLRKSATSDAADRAWHAIQQMPDAEWKTAIEESLQAVGLLPIDAAIAKEPQDA